MKPPRGVLPNINHPRYRGIQFHWLINEGGGGIIRDVSGRGRHGSLVGNASWGRGPQGFDIATDGTGDYIECNSVIGMAGWTEWTMHCLAYYDGSGTDEHTLISNYQNAGTVAGGLLRVEPADNTIEGFALTQSDTQIGGTFSDITLTPYEHHWVTLRFRSGEGLTAFVDGVKSATSYSTSAAMDSNPSTYQMRAGSSTHTSTDDLTGGLTDVRFWHRYLRDAEIMDLVRDPWAEFRNDDTPLFLGAAGTTYTITPSGGLTLGGAPDFIKTQVLSPSGGLTMGGAPDFIKEQIFVPAGGFTLGGAPDFIKEQVQVPAGGLTLGGTGEMQYNVLSVGGGINMGGGASFDYVPVTAGEMVLYYRRRRR